MKIDLIEIVGVILGAMTTFLIWQQKRMIDAVTKLGKDVAVLKDRSNKNKEDHDKLIVVEAQASAAHKRLDELKTGAKTCQTN